MPTDLPKNFHGSAPLEPDRKAMRKLARKALGQSLWQIASSLILHYAVTLAAVAVIAASGFSDVPRAAVSATALGLLARWFLPNKARAQADLQLSQPVHGSFESMGVVELTPDQLKNFFDGLGKATGSESTNRPSPYM